MTDLRLTEENLDAFYSALESGTLLFEQDLIATYPDYPCAASWPSYLVLIYALSFLGERCYAILTDADCYEPDPNTCVCFKATEEEARAEAARLIEEWKTRCKRC